MPAIGATSDVEVEPRRECTSGLEVPEMDPSRTSSFGIAAASFMSSLMLILVVSAMEGCRFFGVLAGNGIDCVWRSCDDDKDMDAASRDDSSCNGSGASVWVACGEGGAVDSSGDSASAESYSGSMKLSVSGKKSEAITTR